MKHIRNYTCVSLLAAALFLAPGIVNAENSNTSASSGSEILFDGCIAKAELTLHNGDRVTLEGKCKAVARQIRKYKKQDLIK